MLDPATADFIGALVWGFGLGLTLGGVRAWIKRI